ncbi:hypothetical protein [Pseudonocardia humida]|uniref:Uncharacterized protein n=1 Tax=Pseudonocardia humida TaxID=2800819 RepID=A0ABT1A9V5_9PSEU|nr:hypothetical protein [Pseudonocardia humida]MCO1659797.1 hypothetical protein [Pseudonocardia humida]
MAADPLPDRARRAWVGPAGVALAFPERGAAVATSAGSRLCPPGRVGIVALGGSAISTVPVDASAPVVRGALDGLSGAELTHPGRLRAALPVGEVLGPPRRPTTTGTGPVGRGAGPARRPPGPRRPAGLRRRRRRRGERAGGHHVAGFLLRDGGDVVAAAGYRHWRGGWPTCAC